VRRVKKGGGEEGGFSFFIIYWPISRKRGGRIAFYLKVKKKRRSGSAPQQAMGKTRRNQRLATLFAKIGGWIIKEKEASTLNRSCSPPLRLPGRSRDGQKKNKEDKVQLYSVIIIGAGESRPFSSVVRERDLFC